jgi:hypothetical protein
METVSRGLRTSDSVGEGHRTVQGHRNGAAKFQPPSRRELGMCSCNSFNWPHLVYYLLRLVPQPLLIIKRKIFVN